MKEALFAQTSCIILSAGCSVRMGTHKALLKIDADLTFIQKITETYLISGIKQVIVVVNAELFKLMKESSFALSENVLLVINDSPDLGRFYSLQTAVKLLIPGNSCFFQNIDNPFTSQELLEKLILHKDVGDVIIPAFQGRAGHPVLISPLVVQEIYSGGDYEVRIDEFLKQFSEKRIDVSDHRILININSPDNYMKAGL